MKFKRGVKIYHFVYIGRNVEIGENTVIGSLCHVDRNVKIGRNVRIQGMTYIPPETVIEDEAFIGPGVVFTNDPYPPSGRLKGVRVGERAVIGAGAIVKAGVTVGRESVVGMGAVVTKDVPPRTVVYGNPASIKYFTGEYIRKQWKWSRCLTIILPVHNEASMLPYVLPSLFKLKALELIVLLDRCRDNSKGVVERLWKLFKQPYRLKFIEANEDCDWSHRLNWLYDYGASEAEGEYLLFTQADVEIDVSSIEKHFSCDGMVSFRNVFPSKPLDHVVTLLVSNIFPFKGFSATITIPRKLYLSKPLSKLDELEWDDQLKANFPDYKYVKAKCINLRPFTSNRLEALGEAKALAKKHPVKVFLWSLIRLKPIVFASYLKARGAFK